MRKDERLDAVKIMRQSRDRLSEYFKGMSYEEQKRYIRERVGVKPTAPDSKKDRPEA